MNLKICQISIFNQKIVETCLTKAIRSPTLPSVNIFLHISFLSMKTVARTRCRSVKSDCNLFLYFHLLRQRGALSDRALGERQLKKNVTAHARAQIHSINPEIQNFQPHFHKCLFYITIMINKLHKHIAQCHLTPDKNVFYSNILFKCV